MEYSDKAGSTQWRINWSDGWTKQNQIVLKIIICKYSTQIRIIGFTFWGLFVTQKKPFFGDDRIDFAEGPTVMLWCKLNKSPSLLSENSNAFEHSTDLPDRGKAVRLVPTTQLPSSHGWAHNVWVENTFPEGRTLFPRTRLDKQQPCKYFWEGSIFELLLHNWRMFSFGNIIRRNETITALTI